MKEVTITIKLHPSQYVSHNKWKCTINGEERLVTHCVVQFSSFNFEDISSKFKLDECIEVSIDWKRDYFIDTHGNPHYHD